MPTHDTSPNEPRTAAPAAPTTMLSVLTRGSLGVGLVLVAMPTLLLFFGSRQLSALPGVGLPLLAIFGIMILFGTLALVAMLFQSLNLSDRAQALALPPGSIHAAIALALIVLFAIISIMLFQTTPGTPFPVQGLELAQRNELIGRAGERVVGMVEEPCERGVTAPAGAAAAASAASIAAAPSGSTPAAASGASAAGAAGAAGAAAPNSPASCPEAQRRYTVYLRPGTASETTDLAKQLLILVGTLMTSVTSFYFASRVGRDHDPAPRTGGDGGGGGNGRGEGGAGQNSAIGAPPVGGAARTTAGSSVGEHSRPAEAAGDLSTASGVTAAAPTAAAPGEAAAQHEAHIDGCDVAITDPTPDEALPPARGGVASANSGA